jgi:hypothetical protein
MKEDNFFDELNERDQRVRSKIINGRKYQARCTDPYGFWHVEGSVAEDLRGSYNNIELLWKAVQAYENAKPIPKEKTILSTDGKGGKRRVPVSEFFEEAV